MKRISTSSFYLLLCFLSGAMLITSCDEKKAIKEIETLTEHFYSMAQEEQFDSLLLLYPEMDFDIFKNIYPGDNMKINEIKSLGDKKYEVDMFLPLHTFFFEKNDSSTFGYIITDSKGLVHSVNLPYYVEACGAIKKEKSYTDMEYLKRYNISKNILYEQASKAADIVNNNVKILFTTTNVFGSNFALTDYDRVTFKVENNTNYSCLGFTIYMGLSDCMDTSCYRGEIRGFWNYEDARLMAHSTHKYTILFDPKTLKKNSEWKNCVTSSRFEITPEAIINDPKYRLNFAGTEYDAYINRMKKLNETRFSIRNP